MSVAKNNKTIPVTLTKYHSTKLEAICKRTGLSKTGVIQRLIERHELFKLGEGLEKEEK